MVSGIIISVFILLAGSILAIAGMISAPYEPDSSNDDGYTYTYNSLSPKTERLIAEIESRRLELKQRIYERTDRLREENRQSFGTIYSQEIV